MYIVFIIVMEFHTLIYISSHVKYMTLNTHERNENIKIIQNCSMLR